MNADEISSAIGKLIRGLPGEVIGPSFERGPLEEALKRELEGRGSAYSVTLETEDGRVVCVLSLEEGRAALYQLLPRPLTLSRKLLHLEGAVVRHIVPLDDQGKETLASTLANELVLTVQMPKGLHELREELESRARAAPG